MCLSLLSLALLATQVSATCYCVSYYTWNGAEYSSTVGCNDVELQAECQRAEWEFTDFVGGFKRWEEEVFRAMPTATPEYIARNAAILSAALETRPVLDCATGVYTTTNAIGSSYYCYSPQLLQSCTDAQAGVSGYLAGIVDYMDDLGADQDFMDLVELRLGITDTLDVECITTSHILEEVDELLCFSEGNTVSVKDPTGVVREVAMVDLRPGDLVEARAGEFEEVYEIPHRVPDAEDVSFLTVATEGSSIELSDEHMLPVHTAESLSAGSDPVYVYASAVNKDHFVCEHGEWQRVTSIVSTKGRGLYAPMTKSGVITVSGVEASCYAGLNSQFLNQQSRWHRYIYRQFVPQVIEADSFIESPAWEKKVMAASRSFFPSLFR